MKEFGISLVVLAILATAVISGSLRSIGEPTYAAATADDSGGPLTSDSGGAPPPEDGGDDGED